MWTKLSLAISVLAIAEACSPGQLPRAANPSSPSPRKGVVSQEASVPRCSEAIPFEPTYLPDGFGHELYKGMFPAGRPPEDQSSIGGRPGEEQVIVHYRGSDSRAIEIRRPGTLFTELAQGNDTPTIEVLGMETSGFAPIEPGGDEFIVQFHYPPGARPHDWCSWYSLNGYGLSLAELKRVARGLMPIDRCHAYPPPFEAGYLPDGFSHRLRPSAGLFKGTAYPIEGLLGHYRGPHETIHVNFEAKGGPLPYVPADEEPVTVLGEPGTIGTIEGGYAVTFTNGTCGFRMDTYGISRQETLRVGGGLREK